MAKKKIVRAMSKEKIIEFIEANDGMVTNSLMQEKHFGDVGSGNKTTTAMRKMADEGKLKMKITHASGATTIEWLLPEIETKKVSEGCSFTLSEPYFHGGHVNRATFGL